MSSGVANDGRMMWNSSYMTLFARLSAAGCDTQFIFGLVGSTPQTQRTGMVEQFLMVTT